VYGCDVSDRGLDIARTRYPEARYLSMQDESVGLENASMDMILSIEVLEHVRDVKRAIGEIGRVLRPAGKVLVTTPCANKYSLEWFYNGFTGGLERSFDGYGRFATDEPSHLRRLNDEDLLSLLQNAGIVVCSLRHRTHLFTTAVEWIKPLRLLPASVQRMIALLDWRLFKGLPNGASMLALGEKRRDGEANG
jgi:SAM-dependent methyltransferase